MLSRRNNTKQRQFWALFRMELFSYGRSLKQNLSKKLTVFVCSLVILALVMHLYHDFVTNYLAEISVELFQVSTFFAVIILLGVGSFFLRRQIKDFLRSPETPRSFARSLGESRETLRIFTYLVFPLFFLLYYVPFWAMSLYFSGNFSLFQKIFSLFLPPFLLIFTFFKKASKEKSLNKEKRGLLTKTTSTPAKALLEWRIRQMVYRNSCTRKLLFLSFLLAFISPTLLLQNKGSLYSLVFAFLSSVLAGISILTQVGRDFRSVWLERACGVSHEEYLRLLLQLSNLIAFCLAFLVSFIFFSLALFYQFQEPYSLKALVKLALVAYSPAATAALVSLQIDPRKVLLHSTILTVLSLIFCSFLVMQPLLFLLFPFILSYAKQSQANRFYTI